MKKHLISLAVATACAFALPALAQTTAAAKTATKAKAKASSKAKAKAPVEAPLAAADAEQKTAAAQTHVGEYACEFDQTVNVAASAKSEGYMDVGFKGQTWVMKPVMSSTGALRLEDVKGRMLMIQIANKSMVMDTKIGQRLVDGCMHEKQRDFAKTMVPSEALLGKQQ